MKKLLILIVSLVMANTAFADGFAKLKLQISGDAGNRYFLCVDGDECLSIQAGDKGESFPIDLGSIDSMHTTDMRTFEMYTVNLPKSCEVALKDNQTITVHGRLEEKNGYVYVEHLNCQVS